MKKPKFLQSFLDYRHAIKQKNYLNSDKCKISDLTYEVDCLKNQIDSALSIIHQLEHEKIVEELEERKKEDKRTDPFSADKWKVVYDADHNVSTVYFNGQELYGVQEFKVDFDAALDGQTPRLTYEGYGSIDIETESE